MSIFKEPLGRCPCGGSHGADEHPITAPAGEEARWNRVVDAAVLRAVLPADAARRQSLKTVGASTHNYLPRYYVAEHGLDPDQDISIRSVPPPEMVANLRADDPRHPGS